MSLIRDFLTRWNFEVNDKPLENAEKKMENLGKRMKNLGDAWGNVSDKAAEFGKAVAVASAAVTAAVGGLFVITRSTAVFGNELAKTSQKLGLSVEELQKFRYAADLSDVSVQDLDGALRIMSKNMEAASAGTGEQAEAFRALGVSVQGADGSLKDTGTTILDLADAFQSMPDGPLKTARAMQVFGKSGAQLIPFLNEGRQGIQALAAEAEALGLIMTEETAKASEQFLDDMSRISKVVTGLKYNLGSVLLPIFHGFISDTLEWVKANRELIKAKVQEWVVGIGRSLTTLWRVMRLGFAVVDRLISMFGGLENVTKLAVAALTLFGTAKIISTFRALQVAIALLVTEIKAVGIAALAAQAATFAIPVAILAAVAAIGLLTEDVMTFFEGGESAFGKFIRMIQDNIEVIKSAFVDVGSTIVEFWIWPLGKFYELLNDVIKTVTGGFDALGSIGIKTGDEGKKQRAGLIGAGFDFLSSPIRNTKVDERGVLQTRENVVGPIRAVGPNQPAITARPEVSRAANASSAGPTTLSNNININASGMTEAQASAAIADALKRSNEDFLRRSGQKSQPRNRE